MPFSWKETRICPRCRKTITRICKKIGHDYQQYSVARKSIVDWCRCNCEPIKDESLVDLIQLVCSCSYDFTTIDMNENLFSFVTWL